MIGVSSVPSISHRTRTAELHERSVKRSLDYMRQNFEEPLTLDVMAEIAAASPFHFNRMFRQVTGLTPGQFLTAIRMDVAKRLLATTDLSVTEVCVSVGYCSLGSFVSKFSRLVGFSPSEFRRSVSFVAQNGVQNVLRIGKPAPSEQFMKPSCEGCISAPDGYDGPVSVGVFDAPVPHARPLQCSVLPSPGRYAFWGVPEGVYYLFAVTLQLEVAGVEAALVEPALRGRGRVTVVRSDDAPRVFDLTLRGTHFADPPILAAHSILHTISLQQQHKNGTSSSSLYVSTGTHEAFNS